jgi:hypothetical protein
LTTDHSTSDDDDDDDDGDDDDEVQAAAAANVSIVPIDLSGPDTSNIRYDSAKIRKHF